MTARHGRPGPDPCQLDHSHRSSIEDSLPVVCSVIREAWEDVGTAGGFQGESCRLRVFSFVPMEPSNLGRAAEKGRWRGGNSASRWNQR